MIDLYTLFKKTISLGLGSKTTAALFFLLSMSLSMLLGVSLGMASVSTGELQGTTSKSSHEHGHKHAHENSHYTEPTETKSYSGVSAQGYAKPGSPVSLEFATGTTAKLNQVATIPFTLLVSAPVEAMTIELTSSEGVQLLSDTRISMPAQTAGAGIDMQASIIATQAGTHTINVMVTTWQQEQKLVRALALAVKADGQSNRQSDGQANRLQPTVDGKGNIPTQPPVQATADGELIVVLPAEEN